MTDIEQLIKTAIQEDIPNDDITSRFTIPDNCFSTGKTISKGCYILSGINEAKMVFNIIDPSITFTCNYNNSDTINKNEVIFIVRGKTQSLLKAERVCLNIMSHMMGIATKTKLLVDILSPHNITLLDTRKTLPGLRLLQKNAVLHGGAKNHRFSLSDAVLIKENHIEIAGGITKALNCFKDYNGTVEIEVKNIEELKEALLDSNLRFPEIIMLDNMNIEQIKDAVKINSKKCKLEVSGGINESNIQDYLTTGIDYISMGALTHSAKSADISFLINPEH